MMKKNYDLPEIEMIAARVEDVIRTSGGDVSNLPVEGDDGIGAF